MAPTGDSPHDRAATASAPVDLGEHNPWSSPPDDDGPVIGRRGWIRLAWMAAAIVVLVLLVTLPPLINVNRYQRRVTQAISGAIGRPVHFDSITMHLLPLPGFTIQNFVVQEDPAFGAEPAMRANVVEARVRFASLWRKRVEISRISLDAPSVNLVRRDDGSWNLQRVISQAAQLQSAPTAQARHSAAPRFPYIEASGARINIKQGDDKLPYSLVDTKFALWLPTEHEWRLRLSGRPLRTDTDVSDVGDLRVEGSLGRDAAAASGQTVDLWAQLSSTPMGEAAKLLLGRDTGWRGAASMELSLKGTPANMLVTSDLHLHNLRRADFVPRLPMSVDTHCQAEAKGVLHELRAVRCAIPTARSTSLFDVMNVFQYRDERVVSAPDVLSLRAEVPNVLELRSATAELDLQRGSPEWVLAWMRMFSTRLPAEEQVNGAIALHASVDGQGTWQGVATCRCIFPATGAVEQPASKTKPGDSAQPGTVTWDLRFSHTPVEGAIRNAPDDVIEVAAGPALNDKTSDLPAGAALGNDEESAPDVSDGLSGQISPSGYTLQYASADVARYAAALLPTLGDSMPTDLNGPVEAERPWGGKQVWIGVAPAPAVAARHRAHRR